ncbi:MAG: hypothetical protein LBB39_00930 [Mycoplasmataceae bacterium]|nr:hypothetical protein [Mycoplasmataceae bacterium]
MLLISKYFKKLTLWEKINLIANHVTVWGSIVISIFLFFSCTIPFFTPVDWFSFLKQMDGDKSLNSFFYFITISIGIFCLFSVFSLVLTLKNYEIFSVWTWYIILTLSFCFTIFIDFIMIAVYKDMILIPVSWKELNDGQKVIQVNASAYIYIGLCSFLWLSLAIFCIINLANKDKRMAEIDTKFNNRGEISSKDGKRLYSTIVKTELVKEGEKI